MHKDTRGTVESPSRNKPLWDKELLESLTCWCCELCESLDSEESATARSREGIGKISLDRQFVTYNGGIFKVHLCALVRSTSACIMDPFTYGETVCHTTGAKGGNESQGKVLSVNILEKASYSDT